MIAIISALKDEVRDILSNLETDEVVHIKPSVVYRGKYRGRDVIVCHSSIGRRAIHDAAHFILTTYHPEICIHVGYAGGTDPALLAGDLIIASEIRERDSNKRYATDEMLRKQALGICKRKNLRHKEGVVVTVNESLNTPHEKAFVGTQYEALSVDMESSGLAAAAEKAKTAFMVVRAILDPLDMPLLNLPAEATEDGDIHIWPVAKHIYRNPGDLLKLPRFSFCANKAREALTAFVDAWLDN